MVVLVGYCVAGIRIVVVGGCRCLGNRVSLQVRATIVAGQAVTRGEIVSLELGITGIVNCFLFVPRICTIVCN